MTKEDLKKLKEELSTLSEEEKKQRDLYLRSLASGEVLGPPVGYASIDKPWLKYYPVHSICLDTPEATAFEMICDGLKDNDDLIVFNYFGTKITFSDMLKKIDSVAKSLKKMGVKPGDIVTLAMPTSPELVYTFYAINRIGAISNCIDPRLTIDGFSDSLNSTKSKFLISVDLCASIVQEAIDKTEVEKVVLVSALESAPFPVKLIAGVNKKRIENQKFLTWKEFVDYGFDYTGSIDFPYKPDYPATIVHTGGTTGIPKGVVLTNDNFNNMAYMQKISEYGFDKGDTFLTFLPPFIAYCLVNAIHDPLYLGLENILIPKFSPDDFVSLMKKYKPNHVLSGPILWDKFIRNKKFKNANLQYLKSPISGGDALNIELEKSVNKFFYDHNCNSNIVQGYGMTEVSAAAVYSSSDSYKTGSVGIPYIKNIVGIFDPDTNTELQYLEEGEICIATPTMMLEYYDNPDETNRIIENKEDGIRWIHTGDVGYIDSDGNLFVKGRMKRMIVRSGNKIFPSTIENIIMQNPLIESCAVVQMPHNQERHVPVSFLVLKNEGIGFEKEIIASLDDKIKSLLPDFNLPFLYIFCEELPLTNIQKIDFKCLEEDAKQLSDISERIIFYKSDAEKTKKKSFY